MWEAWIIFMLFVTCATFDVDTKDKVVYAMDFRPSLNPLSLPKMHLTHLLFEVRLLHTHSDIKSDIDMIAYANYTALSDMYRKSKVRLPTYVENPSPVMDMFDDKAAWKAWMAKVGLGEHVPQVLDANRKPSEHQYPLILKTNAHFGRGVFVVHSAGDLRRITATLKEKKTSYLLEEPLTGLGLSEISVWGSAFRGKLLSMRCVKLTYTQSDLLHSAYKNSSVAQRASAADSNKIPFVQGFQAKSAHEQWLPCGKDVVEMTRSMLEAAQYTGPWCTAMKLDAQMRPKILEVNARFCGSQTGNDGLFLAAFVPLAGAIGRAFPEAKINHALNFGAQRDVFRVMIETEEKMLMTGGGRYENAWVTAEKFDPELRLDHIRESFASIVRRHTRGKSRKEHSLPVHI
jgi:hypothetical protein